MPMRRIRTHMTRILYEFGTHDTAFVRDKVDVEDHPNLHSLFVSIHTWSFPITSIPVIDLKVLYNTMVTASTEEISDSVLKVYDH